MCHLSTHPLAHNWRDGLYTDGACITVDSANSLGAAYYDGRVDRTFTVQPSGHGATNTVVRAELAGICAALQRAATDVAPIHVYTDSLSSLYLIARYLHFPHTLRECKHLHLLEAISAPLKARAHRGARTHLRKVKAHAGCVGNEFADIGAASAARQGCVHDQVLHVSNNSVSSLPAWPVVLPPPAADGGASPEPYTVSDLRSSLARHFHPDLRAGRLPHTKTTQARALAFSHAYPAISTHMWTACPYRVIRHALQARYGTLWTSSRALKFGLPYLPGVATPFPTHGGACPLCGQPDTSGHMLGGCRLPHFHARYIKRHNTGVQILYDSIVAGISGGMFCVMDACPVASLPPGVNATRIPEWMLPLVPPAQRALFRPDLLLIPGLTTETLWMLHSATTPAHLRALTRSVSRPSAKRGRHPARSAAPVGAARDCASPVPPAPAPASLPFTVPAALRALCTVYLVEFSFCNDNNSAERMSAKESQHSALISALEAAGWTVKLIVILVGSAGTVFHPALDFLTSLGVSQHAATLCLRRLHLLAVNTCHSLICDRRHLERQQPLTNPNFVNPP